MSIANIAKETAERIGANPLMTLADLEKVIGEALSKVGRGKTFNRAQKASAKTLADYVLDQEIGDFRQHVIDGVNPKAHIYWDAFVVRYGSGVKLMKWAKQLRKENA